MQIIGRLDKILTEKGISVAKFAEDSGIPPGRVYKWFDGNKPANPKHEDVKKIEDWIQKQVFRQEAETPDPLYTHPTHSDRRSNTVPPAEPNQLLAEKDKTIRRLEEDKAWLKSQLEKLMGTNGEQKS